MQRKVGILCGIDLIRRLETIDFAGSYDFSRRDYEKPNHNLIPMKNGNWSKFAAQFYELVC